MNTLVIDRRGSRVEYRSGAIVVRIPDQRPQNISLNLVDRLVLASSVEIDSTLLTHLSERGISLLAMPGRGVRRSAFMYGYSHGDAQRRINQYGLMVDPAKKLMWARRFVFMKIAGNRRLLLTAERLRPDCRYILRRGADELQSALQNARQADNLLSLRGIEGSASNRFFLAYRSLFPASLSFRERNRRPPRDPVNAALSLAYTLAHGDAVNALVKSGLDPMLGFLHDPSYGRESLACDLVEIVRPRVEHLVWRLFAERQLTGDHFRFENGASRMGKAARSIFFATYESNAAVHRRWLARYAQAISRSCTPTIQETENAPVF